MAGNTAASHTSDRVRLVHLIVAADRIICVRRTTEVKEGDRGIDDYSIADCSKQWQITLLVISFTIKLFQFFFSIITIHRALTIL